MFNRQYFILDMKMISLKFTTILHKFCFQLIKITAYCYFAFCYSFSIKFRKKTTNEILQINQNNSK